MTPDPAYQRIADDLRTAILSGEYPAGTNIPELREIETIYGVGRQTARSAVRQLTTEGLVYARRNRGTVVRDVPSRQPRRTRSRVMLHDDRGYYTDVESIGWHSLAPTVVEWAAAPPDVAAILGVDATTDVVIRHRLVGASPTDPRHIATSHIHPDVVRDLPILGEVSTGPGGTYERLEESGHGPLRWREIISAAAPTPDETERLRLLPGTPVLRILRPATSSGTGQIVDVTVFTMSAAVYQVEHPLTRGTSARWPVAPCAAPNVPFPS